MEQITFASLLTAAGAGIAAGIITSTVELLKRSIPPLAEANGATMAFVLSAVLYALAAIATAVGTLDAALVVFVAWLTCGTAAVGAHRLVVRPLQAQIEGRREPDAGLPDSEEDVPAE
jgi:hypothetical protein